MSDEAAKKGKRETMRNGFVGQFHDASYCTYPGDRWDWYSTLDDAIVSLQNRYDGHDDFWSCDVTDHGEVTCVEPESCSFPAVTTDATIVLYRVVDGRVVNTEYPDHLVRLNEDGDAYVEES